MSTRLKKFCLIVAVIIAVILSFCVTYFGMNSRLFTEFLPEKARNSSSLKILSHSAGLSILCLILAALLVRAFTRMEEFKKKQEDMNRLFGSLFSGLRVGLVVFDEDGIVRYINPAGAKLLQAKTPSLTPLIPYTELIEPVLVPVAEKIASSIRTGEEFSREYRVFLQSGICCVQCDFFTVTGTEKHIAHVLSLEDKTVEDDIKVRLSQQLEETHRYAMSKDNFFANMSHEIRTPINAILGMTYFLKKGDLEPKYREYVAKIENASDLLLGVVNDILDFSKMQEHKFSLNPENFNLPDLKKIILDVFTLKAEQKGLDLHVEFDCPEIYFVNGDQFRLTQIFMNLVSNAIKFTEKGFVSVAVNTETIGNEIILRSTVRDTGCGIAEDDLEKLFTDFEQFGNVLHKNHQQTARRADAGSHLGRQRAEKGIVIPFRRRAQAPGAGRNGRNHADTAESRAQERPYIDR
jgi:signal transduction histidine kinase